MWYQPPRRCILKDVNEVAGPSMLDGLMGAYLYHMMLTWHAGYFYKH